MNYIGQSFNFQQGDELFFQTPQQQQQQQQQKIIPAMLVAPPSIKLPPGKKRKVTAASGGTDEINGEDNERVTKKKKIIHRDVERQRRHEMAMLYSSLRSLLPLEYLKGKRSISDHMNEAANYIRHQQKKIREMTERRDGLRRALLGPLDCKSSRPEGRWMSVIVRPCWSGVEVVIGEGSREGVPLSRVVEMMEEEGLDVLCCASANVNHLVVHTIQSQFTDLKEIDLSGLQQKLTDLCSPLSGTSM